MPERERILLSSPPLMDIYLRIITELMSEEHFQDQMPVSRPIFEWKAAEISLLTTPAVPRWYSNYIFVSSRHQTRDCFTRFWQKV